MTATQPKGGHTPETPFPALAKEGGVQDRAWSDDQRQETVITKVKDTFSGYEISQASGWVCWLDKEHGVIPAEGNTLTLWGRGIGFPIRGLAVGDRVAFYRTEDEDRQQQKVDRYGADAADWLSKWDAGKGVWTVEMGGLSAGYDQCINLLTAEFVRALLKLAPEVEDALSAEHRAAIDAECASALSILGVSGAQYGAALGLAVRFYKLGPIQVIESVPEDRRIQASKSYPTLDPVKQAAPDLLEAALLAEDIIDDFLGHLSPDEQIACAEDPKASAALKALRAAIAKAGAAQ